jgi:DNA invertase Pin-like site-specific DNA recombinase
MNLLDRFLRPLEARMLTPTTDQSLTAVSYARVSTVDQARRGGLAEGFSIPAQRSAIRAKADSVGAVIVKEFVDAGESARSADRPQLQQMLDYLRTHPVDLVIVHKLDRLARDRASDVTINLAIRQAGARLVSVTENVDETPQGQLVHGIFSSVAEFYSRNLAQEVLKGMEQKVRNGGSLGRAPVGYMNIRELIDGREVRTVQVDPQQAPHFRWAFETYANDPDMTISTLTELLKDRGLTLRATAKQPERPLLRSNVHRMLTNRFYLGTVTWKGVEHPGAHEPLIDEQIFSRVQDKLDGNRAGGNRERKHRQYLAGSLYCGRCHSRLLYMVTTGRRGGRYEYFVCSGRHTKSNDCQAPFLSLERVEEAVARIWEAEHEPWVTEALPAVRDRLHEHLAVLRNEALTNTSSLKTTHRPDQPRPQKVGRARLRGHCARRHRPREAGPARPPTRQP